MWVRKAFIDIDRFELEVEVPAASAGGGAGADFQSLMNLIETTIAPDSWEARTTPHEEAFWRFDSPASLQAWLNTVGAVS